MIKNKKRKGKIGMWITIGIIGFIVLVIVIALSADAPRRNELKNLTISEIDFSSLQDGTYIGAYHNTKSSLSDAEVEVVIENGEIMQIVITNGALAGEKQTTLINSTQSINDLIQRIIDSKSLQVDVISGATLTCNAHLKAIEDALIKAIKQD